MKSNDLFQNLANASQAGASGLGDKLSRLAGGLPGGLAGGAAAGGVMALLMSSKKARKFAGKAATVGGAAVLGGLAFKAFQNWQAGNATAAATGMPGSRQSLPSEESFQQAAAGNDSTDFDWTLIQVMIAAARADGHLDAAEQQKIVQATREMQLSPEAKGRLFELMTGDIDVASLFHGGESIEQRTEIYLAARLAIEPDHMAERTFLRELAARLQLPGELTAQLDAQAAAL